MKWIAITDQPPEKDQPAIFYDGKTVFSGFWDSRGHATDNECYEKWTGITHWMPLPEPPK